MANDLTGDFDIVVQMPTQAMNRVFAPCYAVEEDEVLDEAKVREKWPKDQFIFDIQTHHVDVAHKWYEDTDDGRAVLQFFRLLRGQAKLEDNLELLNRDHYIKEIFFDSDTVMAVISGVPTRDWNKNPLPPDQMAATRDRVNRLAQSERVLAHESRFVEPMVIDTVDEKDVTRAADEYLANKKVEAEKQIAAN